MIEKPAIPAVAEVNRNSIDSEEGEIRYSQK